MDTPAVLSARYEGRIIGVMKPKGPTSNSFLTRLKYTIGIKKVGHAGTLDPLASGVLVVGFGREATKRLWDKEHDEKEYSADIDLTAFSATDDAEGEKTFVTPTAIPTEQDVRAALVQFTGAIEQMPPVYSALKVAGKSAYLYVRKGKEVELKSRTVVIKEIELLSYEWPHARLRVVTGPGAYIRALARDIGVELGTGGFVSDLVRTRVGTFTIENSLTLETL